MIENNYESIVEQIQNNIIPINHQLKDIFFLEFTLLNEPLHKAFTNSPSLPLLLVSGQSWCL